MNTASRRLYHIDILITLKTPWLVQGSEPGRYGLDATLLRDHESRPILPGSLIAGRIQAAWNKMKNAGLPVPADTEKRPKKNPWFGDEGSEDNLHARIWTNDLIIDNDDEALLQATRITVDQETEAVKSGHLLLIEQTQTAGDSATFKGRWFVYLAENESKYLAHHLRAGLLWHSQLGAQRSIGFGELQHAQVTLATAVSRPYPEQGHAEKKRLILRVDRPLCVATRSRRGNVFESSDIITGGTFKGALARLFSARYNSTIGDCKEKNQLAKYFDAIRISHALPSNTGKRPSAIPLSLASVDGCMLDLAKINKPCLIDGKAPAFMHDWKNEWSDVNATRGWGKTTPHLRVRTAINADQRIAEEEKLFAYQCKVPEPATVWLTEIALPEMIENSAREEIWNELAQLLENGLGPIGKTDAWADVAFNDQQKNVWPQHEIEDGDKTITLMLNSPALLLASSQIADKSPQDIDLTALYQKIFSDITGRSLTLSHFYASHSMAGGEFLWKRYMKNRSSSRTHYQPFILTDAGSVFVLNIHDRNEAKKIIGCWQQQGLTLPDIVVREHGKNWNQNPFIPENGFGEIAVNVSHGYHAPDAKRLTFCDDGS